MAKNIVVCFDGTWNGVNVDDDKDGVPEDTNVLKIYRLLSGQVTPETRELPDEEEKIHAPGGNVEQVIKYLHGVGDVANPIGKLIGGALGAGIIKRIVRGYTFISRNYQPGDRIFVIGFSRGAYTARAVAGMIAKAGLMDYAALGNPKKDVAYQLALNVWCYYKQGKSLAGDAPQGAEDLWGHWIQQSFQMGEEHLIKDVPIECVAVFDTVGALGIPRYSGEDERVDVYRFADTELSPRVRKGLHAVAIDDYRRDFTPTLWTGAHPGVTQLWFVGAHADVGGGYEDRDAQWNALPMLSDITLSWMVKQLTVQGLRFAGAPPAGDPLAEIHDSWNRDPYKKHPRRARTRPAGTQFHASVNVRLASPNAGGTPPGTPSPYRLP